MEKLNIQELTKNEIITLNGGCFSFDVGWLIGASIRTAGGSNPTGVLSAIADYAAHYVEHE